MAQSAVSTPPATDAAPVTPTIPAAPDAASAAVTASPAMPETTNSAANAASHTLDLSVQTVTSTANETTGVVNNIWDQMMMWGTEWLPKLIAALVILIVAHFLAKGFKWAVEKMFANIPILKNSKTDIGKQLGEIGYWLIWLVGLIASLTPLGLDAVVAPLQTLANDIFGFLPNIVGACLIFFIGSMIAKVTQQVVEATLRAAHAEKWAEKAGLNKITGSAGISGTIGAVVFALIIIPVAIAALQALKVDAISTPAVAVLASVLSALPKVLSAAIVLAISFFIGRWVATLIEQILPPLGFDKAIKSLGILPGTASGSKVAGNIALAAVMIFAAVEAANLLQFEDASHMLRQVIELGSQVLFGGAIIAASVAIANMLSTIIGKSSGEKSESFAPQVVRYATIALGTAMGLRFMGLANDIITIGFGLVLGAVAVACALAFGLGGREAAGKVLSKWVK